MAELELPTNSYKSKFEKLEEQKPEERQRPTRVVKGRVVKRKKNPFARFFESILYEDGNNLGTYIVQDILIPAIKDLLHDVITGGTDRALYGQDGRRPSKPNTYTSYGQYYSSGSSVTYRGTTSSQQNHQSISSIRTGRALDDILFDSRMEAEDVLGDLLELVEQYGSASVMDYYDLVGATSVYTDAQYGWFNLGSVNVRHTRDGYMICLPKPVYLN